MVRGQLPVVSGQLPVVRGQLSVVSCSADVTTGAIAPNEPTDIPENVTDEPTADREIAPNEPTHPPENVTNEPTADREIAERSHGWSVDLSGNPSSDTTPTYHAVDAPNVTNEAIAGLLSAVRRPLAAAACSVAAVDALDVANEPTAGPLSVVSRPLSVVTPNHAAENVTNRPYKASGIAPNALIDTPKKAPAKVEVVAHRNDGDWIQPAARRGGGDDKEAGSRNFDQELGVSMIQALVNRKSMRMHEARTRAAEERRKEVERLMAERRAPARPQATEESPNPKVTLTGDPRAESRCEITGQLTAFSLSVTGARACIMYAERWHEICSMPSRSLVNRPDGWICISEAYDHDSAVESAVNHRLLGAVTTSLPFVWG